MHRSRRGFTIVELVACVGAAGVLSAVAVVGVGVGGGTSAPSQPPSQDQIEHNEILRKLDELLNRFDKLEGRIGVIEKEIADARQATRDALKNARNTSTQLKDATQLRGIVQALVIWAQNNEGKFPLLSKLDLAGNTIRGEAESKDTTANIFSILVFNGFIPTDMCVSPAEVNSSIKPCDTYEFNEPKAAANPKLALWDPAFSADFTGGRTGNVSYGHALPFGERLANWSDTFNASQALAGNRGPEVLGVNMAADGAPVERLANPASNTMRIHGAMDTWEGNTAYGDSHVNFETRLTPGVNVSAFENAQGKKVADCLFFDEPEDAKHTNNYLGIFVSAGKRAQDWKAIWD